MEVFQKRIPEILTLCNLDLKDRHWEAISNIVGFNLHPNQMLTIKKILNLNLAKFVPQFEIISDGASKESSLEKKLNVMMEEWKDLTFTLVDYRYTTFYLTFIYLKVLFFIIF